MSGLEKLLLAVFGLWFFAYGFATPVPINEPAFRTFDVMFILTAAVILVKKSNIPPVAMLCAAAAVFYLAADALGFHLIPNPYHQGFSSPGALMNFIYADKFIAYIIILAAFCGKRAFGYLFYKRFLLIFLIALTIKYGALLVLRIDDRPRLIVENNYEMMWLLIAFSVFAIMRRRMQMGAPTLYFIWVCALIVLCGSRSVAIGILPVALLLYFRANVTGVGATLVALPLGGILAASIFLSRTADFERLDRFRFLNGLLAQLPRFEWYNYVIGMKPLTPLLNNTCQNLSFYASMFSSEGDGQCYSLILHSFFMRAFFDHGILGATIPFVMVYLMLSRSGFKRGESLCFVMLAAICGLSVSGIGTSFVAFPIAMAMAWRPPASQRTLRDPDQGRAIPSDFAALPSS